MLVAVRCPGTQNPQIRTPSPNPIISIHFAMVFARDLRLTFADASVFDPTWDNFPSMCVRECRWSAVLETPNWAPCLATRGQSLKPCRWRHARDGHRSCRLFPLTSPKLSRNSLSRKNNESRVDFAGIRFNVLCASTISDSEKCATYRDRVLRYTLPWIAIILRDPADCNKCPQCSAFGPAVPIASGIQLRKVRTIP